MNELNLVKYMFNIEFKSNEWTTIILSKIHDDLLWLGDSQVLTDNDLIHEVTSLRNEDCNPMNIKNLRKMVEKNLNIRFNGRNMKVNTIQDEGVRLLNKILGYKFSHGSRLDSIPTGLLHTTYVIVMKGEKVNLCKII